MTAKTRIVVALLVAAPVVAIAAHRLGADAATVAGCRAIDGDTLVCGSEHIRLLAADAPELPGHCRRGRVCAPGDPYAAQAALALDLGAARRLTAVRIEKDRYGRTVADVIADGESLSCRQIHTGHAIYWRRYDRGGRIRKECGL